MAVIELTQGYSTLVDDVDYEYLSKQKWWIRRNGSGQIYANGTDPTNYNKRVYMHRIITNAPKGMFVDHINGNTLDNRKENLRLCTPTENTYNNRRKSKYGYKGISYRGDKKTLKKPWTAFISVDGKPTYLGYFETAEGAARAYDKAAMERFGEFANLNFERIE